MGWVVKHRTSGEQVGPEFRKRRDAEIAAGNDPDLELHPTRIPPELLPASRRPLHGEERCENEPSATANAGRPACESPARRAASQTERDSGLVPTLCV